MPDTLANLTSPVEPPALAPTARMQQLQRAMIDSEKALNASREDDEGLLSKRYFKAVDRFMTEPITTMGDILLKLETVAIYEEIEKRHAANPRLVYANILLGLLRDLRGLTAGSIPATVAPPLDLVAIHAAADKEVDEIYRRQGQIDGALSVLREIAGRICGESFPDEKKVLFLLDVMAEAADGILYANDRLTNAINPLNPTVLDKEVR